MDFVQCILKESNTGFEKKFKFRSHKWESIYTNGKAKFLSS